jgi:hypothetical protein
MPSIYWRLLVFFAPLNRSSSTMSFQYPVVGMLLVLALFVVRAIFRCWRNCWRLLSARHGLLWPARGPVDSHLS